MNFLFRNLKDYFFEERNRFVVWLSVLFGMGIGFYFFLGQEPPAWVSVVGIEILLTLMFIWRHSEGKMIALIALLVVLFGFVNIELHTIYQQKKIEFLDQETISYIQGKIVKIDQSSRGKVRLTLDHVSNYEKPLKGSYRITLSASETDLIEGDCVEMIATLMPPFLPSMPQGYQFNRKSFFEGLSASGYANSAAYQIKCHVPSRASDDLNLLINDVRRKIVARISQQLPADEAAIASAIVAGDKTQISSKTYDHYRNSGLAHFLSISGLHMSMIAAMAFFAFRLMLSLIPQYARRWNSRKAAAVFAMFMSFVYLLISGAQIPTQRAFIMTFVVLLGILFDRRAISMRMLSIAALVVLVISPYALISAGFQMSFAAVAVLIAFYERFAKDLKHYFSGKGVLKIVVAYVVGILISDMVASLATLPFAIYHFNQVAVYTTLGNLLAGPIIGLLIMPFVLLSLFLMPFSLEAWALKIVGFGLALVNQITQWVASLPYAGFKIMSMPLWGLVLICLGGLWLAIWQLKWRRWGIVLVLAGILSLFMVKKPDVLYSSDGMTIALKDHDGNIVVMPSSSDLWTQQNWLEKTVSLPIKKAERKELGKIYRGEKTDPAWLDLDCRSERCVYRNLFVWDKNGKIEIGGVPINPEKDAGGAVYFRDDRVQIDTIREYVGCRPWNRCGKF